ncbi:MAG TPA: hypothetical protein VNT76_24415, partial [Candidatus Binatus sp.]|nr:hypothetical protein [Candidatus Binatus sp.]
MSAAAVAAGFLVAMSLLPRLNANVSEPTNLKLPDLPVKHEDRVAVKLEHNESFAGLLARYGLKPGATQELLNKVYQLVDLRRVPKGQPFNLIVDAQDREVRGVEFIAQDYLVRASATLGGWNVERQEMAHVIRRNILRFKLNDARQQIAARAAISPEQFLAIKRMFSSEIDLSSDIGASDEIEIVTAQKHFLDGHAVGGPMLAAKLLIADRAYYAFGFFGSDGVIRYYNAEGNSLPRPFLAAPLRFDRISSTFDLARPDPVSGVV